MTDATAVRYIALGFPKAVEAPHFEKTSFRVSKKIFATMEAGAAQVTIKLCPVDQDVFMTFDRKIIYPVPGKWGLQGWTVIELERVHPDLLRDALTQAYCTVAPKKLADLVREAEAP